MKTQAPRQCAWRHLLQLCLVFLPVSSVAFASDGWLRDRSVEASSIRAITVNHRTVAGASSNISLDPTATPFSSSKTSAKAGLASSSDEQTPEITALTRGVLNGPDPYVGWFKLLLYVSSQFEYEHYYGCKKGAQLTLLEKKGNDADLSALLVSMLRAGGYQARYGYGIVGFLTYDDVNGPANILSWLGCSDARLVSYNATRGFPATYTDGPYRAIHRVWAEVLIGSQWVPLDPACKRRTRIVPSIDALSASAYSRSGLQSASGGILTGNSAVRSINESALGTYLVTCTSNLLSVIDQTAHDVEPARLVGGWSWERFPYTQVSRMIFPGDIWDLALPPTNWTSLPDALCTRLTLEIRDNTGGALLTSASLPTALLQGAKLALTFTTNDASGRAQLWLDDSLIAEETNSASGTAVKLKLTIDHPHSNDLSGVLHDQASERSYTRGAVYVLTYGFSPSAELLRKRQEKLDAYRREGQADGSRQVVTETLNVMGLTWLHETELFQRLLAGGFDCEPTYHHRFGRVSQESGFYIDVDVQYSGFFALSNNAAIEDQLWSSLIYVDSAMEHAVIEQLQGATNAAVSTVKLLRMANQKSGTDGTIFYATPASWPSIQSQLQGYSGSDLAKLQSAIAQGGEALLPLRGDIALNQWQGAGYVIHSSTNATLSVGMFISGNLNGGYSSLRGNLSAPLVSLNGNANPLRVNTTPIATPSSFGKDPIDLASGDYYLPATDLEVGGKPPRGFSFVRHYHGGRRWVDPTGLGYGWTHNWQVRATRRSAYEPALGLSGTAYDVASALLAVNVLLDLELSPRDARNWTLANMVAHWLSDQLQDNAIAISLGERSLQFVRRADSVWQPAGGITSSLTTNTSGLVLRERHGNSYIFDSDGKLTRIDDLWGNSLTLAYASNRLSSITDAYSRGLTFTYTNQRLAQVADTAGRSVQFSYDTNAYLVSVRDPEGFYDYFSYDAEHRITEVRDHDGSVIAQNVYDGTGAVTEQWSQGASNRVWRYYYVPSFAIEEDPLGGRTYSLFDSKKRVVGNRDANGGLWQRLYDGQNRVITTITPLLRTNRNSFDRFHNVMETIDPDGFTNSNTYDSQQRLVATRDQKGRMTWFDYNAQHQPTRITNALQEVTLREYDPGSGNLVSVTDAASKTTTFGFNSRDEQVQTVYPNGDRETTVRNVFGDPIEQTDARTNTTTMTYNLRRQLLTFTVPGGATSTNGYDNSRRLAFRTDFRGNTTRYSYSPTGKLLVTTRPDGSQAREIYDARDWRVTSINELNQTNTFVYDAAGRLRQQRDGLRRLTTFEFDADGRQTNAITPLQYASGQTYNLRGLVLTTRDFTTNFSTNVFDEAGLRIAFVNRRGYTNSFLYDELNRQLASVSPLRRTNSQTWNNRGFVESIRQPSGRTTAVIYDDRGREQSRTDAVGTVTRSYDGAGNVLQVTEGTNIIRRTFDPRNRISTYSDGRGHTLSYVHDDNGNLKELTYEPGKTVTYTYDNRDRMRTVTDWNGRTTTLSYDTVGRLVRIDRPNGTRRILTWDDAGQLVRVDDRHTPSGEPIVGLRMRYDANGRLSSKLELPSWPIAPALPQRLVTYNTDNQPLTVNGASISNDADGNVTVAPAPLGQSIQVYSWNARNQLLAVSTNTFFFYDAEGNRIRTVENATNTSFLVDPSSALSRLLVRERNDGRKVYYIYGPMLLYEIAQEPALPTNTCRFYHFDHFGSTIALTDINGKVTGRAAYTAYGQLAQSSGVTDTPYLWQGAYGIESDASGLHYMRNRYFSAGLGRFLSEDPLGLAAGPNVYAYADGNPISNNDPSGLFLETAWDVLNIGIDVYSLQADLRAGQFGWAIVDSAALLIDTTAAVIPFIPGGAGTAVKVAHGSTEVLKLTERSAEAAESAGKAFTRSQKREILEANRLKNNGELRSDLSGELLVPAQKAQKGVTPSLNEAHVDHIYPRSKGGPNTFENAQVLSRQENLLKGDKIIK